MPEHLNVVVVLERAVSATERVSLVSDLSGLYSPHFENLHEVCRNNVKTGASHCEPWPGGRVQLEVAPGREELLFIYSDYDRSPRGSGARSSIHIEESGDRTLFTISLPLPRELGFALIAPRLLATGELAGHIPGALIVLAGWELEGDIGRPVEDILRGILDNALDDTLCLWVAGPRQLIPEVPLHFAIVGESDDVVLLARRQTRGAITVMD